MLDNPKPLATPTNETILQYQPGSAERASLKAALAQLEGECPEIPHRIGGASFYEGAEFQVRAPHKHAHIAARVHHGGAPMASRAIEAARKAAPEWSRTSFEERARIFQRAAELLAGPHRMRLNAATMLGQSKTAYQSEIDAACELIDFLRFNVYFASKLTEDPISPAGVRNSLELRPLEGFIYAITPFNFTAIGGNLPAAPALMGNCVVWKPAEDQSLAAHYTMQLFEAAGLPPGVINVVYGEGSSISGPCLAAPDLAGIHFTGSTRVFQSLWQEVGARISDYRSYPRIVGETGGKDFVLAHPSADPEAVAVGLVRGAFEYQGQKCSAASRAYMPKSLWPAIRERVLAEIDAITLGDVADFRHFMGAVINQRAYERLVSWRDRLRKDATCTVVRDAGYSREVGWFCGPTLVEVADPKHSVMQEELFGPLLAVYVYDDAKYTEVLELIDSTSPYALTGAVFAQDRSAVRQALDGLRNAAGNFYINDKPTGAVVGQQPFGGARGSGTNDKAGASYNLLRWASPRTVKETYVPARQVGYPFMSDR